MDSFEPSGDAASESTHVSVDREASFDVRPGDVLAGKYRIERILGRGGMGVVVAAHHLQLDEKVALKFLLPEALHSPEAVGRFVREARAAVKIKSEHVARVVDVGQLENGAPYIVMEYLDGGDLADWLQHRGALPIGQAVDFILQTCEAIADAHALGIVHRDLKPANLFCIRRSDGQLSIKVLDFGISKVTTAGAPGHDMTRTSALMGSPFYMSPEQMQLSKGVDSRTDIWALGIILFELVTGRTPFVAQAVTELAIKVVNEPPASLRALVPSAPRALEQVIARCLEKDRARRFQTVGELAIALSDFGSKAARTSVERVLGTLRQAGLSAAVLPSSERMKIAASPAPVLTAPGTVASWGQTGPAPTTRVGNRSAIRAPSGARYER
jgi:serine/threonine protein kinase